MIQVITRKDSVREFFNHADAVQAVPNEDWIYLYNEAGDICAMYFSANVINVRVFVDEKAGEQNMSDENSDKSG